jgi:hypothetical protein
MPKVSPRAKKVFGPVPSGVYVIGAVLLTAQLIAGTTLGLQRLSGPDPVRAEVTAPPSPPQPRSPEPEIVETQPAQIPSRRPSPTPTPEPPAKPALDVVRAKPGQVIPLPDYKGNGSRVIGRVKDSRAGLSFAELGAPWGRSRTAGDGLVTDGRYSRRQTFATETYGGGSNWWADIDSQRLWSDIDAGTTMFDAAAAFLDHKQTNNFPSGTRGRDVASQSLTVGRHKGWLIARQMRMPKSEAGRRARTELSVAVAVDTGKGRPSILWITIPETHKRLWPDIRQVVNSIRVL